MTAAFSSDTVVVVHTVGGSLGFLTFLVTSLIIGTMFGVVKISRSS